ncbi:MAG: hypothetical protein NWF07_00790, partial [Candidatus Bathyarchaeota archaeon]|nr:hypothetical protein [Candidatus Bathyarchaeota archaeon]
PDYRVRVSRECTASYGKIDVILAGVDTLLVGIIRLEYLRSLSRPNIVYTGKTNKHVVEMVRSV